MADTKPTTTIAAVSVRGIVHAVAPADPERYSEVTRLGAGGMGTIDEVSDRLLGRSVARKSVHANADPAFTALLVAEAQVCAQLEHPAIVPVHDLHEHPTLGIAYTMRIVRGRTLRELLASEDRVQARHRLLSVVQQVCMAVEYAHSRGVVHRDLKPANIVTGEFGEVYVLDWGMAYLLDGSDVRRNETVPVSGGSPGYMAPEQIGPHNIGTHTDVFALGIILYQVLCGRRPFRTVEEMLLRAPPANPREVDANAPTELAELALRCIAFEPHERPARARDVADAIESFFSGERERATRGRAAETAADEGDASRERHAALTREATRLLEAFGDEMGTIPSWESVARKQTAWSMLARSRRLAVEAGDAFASSSAAYTRALMHAPDLARARAGLTSLHLGEFERLEREGLADLARHQLALARTYDDAGLAVSDGKLVVRVDVEDACIDVARYETDGILLRPSTPVRVPADGVALPYGSYVVTVTWGTFLVRAPVVIRRRVMTTMRLCVGVAASLPSSMLLVAGGPFLARRTTSTALDRAVIDDFAVSRFPVTLREYASMLDDSSDAEREVRTPRTEGKSDIVKVNGRWEVSPWYVEGDAARARVADPLALPVTSITWFDADAYCRWLARKSALPYRLPTLAEMDKATHGVDGRATPMAIALDPAFAKLRESRPEASQPEPVGAFALDESPYGVRDVAGGVTSWTSSFVDGGAPPSEDERGGRDHVRRAYHFGGSWSFTAYASRIGMSEQGVDTHGAWIGFRVALSLPRGSVVEEAPL